MCILYTSYCSVLTPYFCHTGRNDAMRCARVQRSTARYSTAQGQSNRGPSFVFLFGVLTPQQKGSGLGSKPTESCNIYIYIYICIHVYVYISLSLSIYIYIYTYTYIYIYIYMSYAISRAGSFTCLRAVFAEVLCRIAETDFFRK